MTSCKKGRKMDDIDRLVTVSGKHIGTLTWELPSHIKDVFDRLPIEMQESLKQELQNKLSGYLKLIAAGLYVPRFTKRLWESIDVALITASHVNEDFLRRQVQ